MKILDICEGQIISLPERVKEEYPNWHVSEEDTIFNKLGFTFIGNKRIKKIKISVSEERFRIIKILSKYSYLYDEKHYKGVRKFILNYSRLEQDNRYEIF